MPAHVVDLVGKMAPGNAQPHFLQHCTDLLLLDDVLVPLSPLLPILFHTHFIQLRSIHAAHHCQHTFVHKWSFSLPGRQLRHTCTDYSIIVLNQPLSSPSPAPGSLIATFSQTGLLHHLLYLDTYTLVKLIALRVPFRKQVGPTTCHKDVPCHTKYDDPLVNRKASLECL